MFSFKSANNFCDMLAKDDNARAWWLDELSVATSRLRASNGAG